MKHIRHVQFAAFVLVVAAYVAIRFWNLTESCLWFDEIFSVHAAEHSWNSILSFVALDLIHPPLYYVLLKFWITAGGESLFWLRLFPVLFSVVSLVPFVLFLREMKQNKWVEILALFLLTVNGSLIKYAQEVRMYSLLMCLSLFSMWLFSRYFVKGRSFLPLVIINLLLVYTHYFGWFVILSEVVAIIIFQREKSRRILTMFTVTFVSFVPWIYAVWQAAQTGSGLSQNIGWMSRPGPKAIVQFALTLIEPFYYQPSSIDPISTFRVSLPMLLITGVAVTLFFADRKQRNQDELQVVKLLGVFAALPLVVAFVASWLLPYSIFGTRHLIIVFAPLSIFLAIAITRISSPALRTATITLIVLFSGYAFVARSLRDTPQYSWCAWGPLAVQAMEKSPATIYAFEDVAAYHGWFALNNAGNQSFEISKIRDMDGVTEDPAYFLPRGFDAVKSIEVEDVNASRFWITYRGQQMDEAKQPLKAFLARGYHVVDSEAMAAIRENVFIILLEK